MDKQALMTFVEQAAWESELALVPADKARRPDIVGMRMYGPPLFGFGGADDPAFEQLQLPQAVGAHLLLPHQWLEGARTVISVFFPLERRVLESNAKDPNQPSEEWLNARIEGHQFIVALSLRVAEFLRAAGYAATVPSADGRFWSNTIAPNRPNFTSNWSERHAAYVCGLGTFGLSRGLITARGMAGRLTSVITTLPLDPTTRPYDRYDAYCTRCGACAANCPVGAITLKHGKNQRLCSDFLDGIRAQHPPYYGCGKCQVNVPCSTARPGTV